MKALILAAGLGTRLKPFTLYHPKALAEVGGRPMLENVLRRLNSEGFDDITVNIHHFGEQILEWLGDAGKKFGNVHISDERGELLDTGGAIFAARPYLDAGSTPFLVHNVDILSDAPLRTLMKDHVASGRDVTLLVSRRESSRRLVFGCDGRLKAWHHTGENRYIPADYKPAEGDEEFAFSGIQSMSSTVFSEMERQGRSGAFPVIDFLLASTGTLDIGAFVVPDLRLTDIGKPETLAKAESMFLDLFQ